ncbi:MAG: hypothetical protein KGN78_15090 [Actinomycetales bacterium]|nr:hypothetical protein [Actinomycetales bacterium]
MRKSALRLMALVAAAGMTFGGVQSAAWASDDSQPGSCSLEANADSPICADGKTFTPDDGASSTDEGRDDDTKPQPVEPGCYDEYGFWVDSCVRIDDPIVDPVPNCDVSIVVAEDGTESKVMTCTDEQGNLLYTVTYDANGCRVTTDATGNATVECPEPWQYAVDPVCEVTTATQDDGSVATTTVCRDADGNVLYKSFATSDGCVTWTDSSGRTETECYAPGSDGSECSIAEDGTEVCAEPVSLEDDVKYATGGGPTRGDNCMVCRGNVSEVKSAVKQHGKKAAKKARNKDRVAGTSKKRSDQVAAGKSKSNAVAKKVSRKDASKKTLTKSKASSKKSSTKNASKGKQSKVKKSVKRK